MINSGAARLHCMVHGAMFDAIDAIDLKAHPDASPDVSLRRASLNLDQRRGQAVDEQALSAGLQRRANGAKFARGPVRSLPRQS